MANKTKKAPHTMVMQIANAHAFSIGFIGIQLTHGYVAALGLSSVSVIVGMVVSLLARFNGQLWPAIAFGTPLGAVVAFVFDSMTLFGLKMVHVSNGPKKAFSFVLIALGIGLSTMAGDQMWAIIYADWHGIVLAASVSCVIVMMDVWHEEHEKAVKQASQQSDAMQTALNTEVEIVVDKKLRLYTHEQLNAPEMEQTLRERSRDSVKQIVEAKFNKRLQQFAGEENGQIKAISEEQRPALPAPRSQTSETDLQAQRDAAFTDLDMIEDRMYRMLTPQILAELTPLQGDLEALVAELHQRFPQYASYLTHERVGHVMNLVKLDMHLEQSRATQRPALPAPSSEQPNEQPNETEVPDWAQEEPDQDDQSNQQEQTEQTEERPVDYAAYREQLINMLEHDGVGSVTAVAKQAGVPRSTMGRWITKAQKELDSKRAAEEEQDNDRDAHIIDMSSKRASHSGEEEASERLTFEHVGSKQASHANQ